MHAREHFFVYRLTLMIEPSKGAYEEKEKMESDVDGEPNGILTRSRADSDKYERNNHFIACISPVY